MKPNSHLPKVKNTSWTAKEKQLAGWEGKTI
uniref:Uncharacterized protein n=1 Tax=Anguilla anguilla TaxID=7936 RepID=A0A0E9U4Z2_ANGAN